MRKIRHTRRHLPFARAFIREIKLVNSIKTLLAPALFERFFQLRINISKAKV